MTASPREHHPIAVSARRNHRVVYLRSLVAVTGALVLGVGLTACGSSHKTTTESANGSRTSGSGSGGRFGGFSPGVTGSVTSVGSSGMKVKTGSKTSSKVAWTSSTVFEETGTVPKSAIKAGACVTARSSGKSSSAASVVTISSPVKGSCTTSAFGGFGGGGFGGAGGGFPRGSGSGHGGFPGGTLPGGTFPGGGSGKAPSFNKGSLPSGFARGGANFAEDMVSGKVLSVSGDKLVVNGTRGFSTSKATKRITVDLASSARITETKTVNSKAVSVGDCVTAIGSGGAKSSSSASKVTARQVEITGTGHCTYTTAGSRFGGSSNG